MKPIDQSEMQARIDELVSAVDAVTKAQQAAFVILVRHCVERCGADPNAIIADLLNVEGEWRQLNEHQASLHHLRVLADGIPVALAERRNRPPAPKT